ncbi:alpha/beta hydrolase fold domain-containing protein [Mucilaginibacter ginsenosidivorax]|uniref:Steryl acetyl hydrolase n=1 Tax=Mucilaginibacter ginsenosidivorax TaxID=862126 RepID=A0A5B8W8G1_9SPHI|nr:alpha/beta hydrolase fold domain-containing protein [Mucilaginibacter ginsenosidivorax]QEC78528.1 steryl acetyl hydrolase [Mucilaginibacter ginsenosidivorax]
MKKPVQLILSALVLIILASCSSKLSISKGQEATLTPQAVALLQTFKVVRLPFINPSDKMLINARNQFAVIEKAQLEEMKARFHPLIQDTTIENVKVAIIIPKNIKPGNEDKIMLYIHGGGYIMGSATDRTGVLMANELGIKTYSVDYHLAPEAKYPVALNECLAVYKYLVGKYDPRKIIGLSTSAGSGHMLGALLKAQELNLPMIKAIALLSPGVDLTNSGDAITANDGRDLIGAKNQADKFFAAPYAGKASLTDPFVSPIYGKYTSAFPPTVIVTGTRDLFLSGSVRLSWKLKDAHVPTELLVSEGMWHAFTNYPDLPEAIQSRNAVEHFLTAQLKKENVIAVTAAGLKNDTTKNIAIVKKFINEVVNGGHLEQVDQLWAPDMTWKGGSLGEIDGIDNYKKFLAANVGKAFTQMHLDVKEVIASGDKVMLRFTNSGHNTGSFMGMKPTGKKAEWTGMGVYRIRNGKIAEGWFSEDILQMYQQLGVSTLTKQG